MTACLSSIPNESSRNVRSIEVEWFILINSQIPQCFYATKNKPVIEKKLSEFLCTAVDAGVYRTLHTNDSITAENAPKP